MKDVSDKISTQRIAEAKATLRLSPSTVEKIKNHSLPKGNALEVAKVAAIQAAKNTHQIIPYCHPIPVDYVGVEYDIDEDSVCVRTIVKAIYKTGVEMEALTSASVAVLTIYDMVKMFDELAEIEGVTLLSKSGGKSDFYKKQKCQDLRAKVIVLSDSLSQGEGEDKSGKTIVEHLLSIGFAPANVELQIIADDPDELSFLVTEAIDKKAFDLVVTTGGTGVSPTDLTFTCLQSLIEKPLPGVVEAIRTYGQKRNPLAMLSRQVAGTRGKALIVSLPGSNSGVKDAMIAAFPHVLHSLDMLNGQKHKSEKAKQTSASK
ncbi:MAG: bifunctional molybdenum cofactor biosynthesis protein MoaC/MoaB [Cyanobacteria bacterium TGS_CYA1]|nr:bifunctional molybdenum cofactor biosynthesis protein MoaC/MoaB [Cyanobacteria bacterium TGS_CYA1]